MRLVTERGQPGDGGADDPVAGATAGPSPGGPNRRDGTGPGTRSTIAWGAAMAVLVVPLVVQGVVAWRHQWQPVGDPAMIELQIRDVASHLPLYGAYSRLSAHHPGPLSWWLLAPLYRLTGSTSPSLLIAGALANAAVVTGMLVVLWRRGRSALLVPGVLVIALLVRASGYAAIDPWNAWLPVLPFGFLVLLCWAMACGRARYAPVAALVASYVAQCHVGYVLPAIALFAWGGAGLVLAAWRRHEPNERSVAVRRLAPVAGLCLAIGLLAWSGPLIEQVTGDPGNLTRIVRSIREGDVGGGQKPGPGRTARLVGRELAPIGPWITGEEPLSQTDAAVVGAPLLPAGLTLAVFAGAAFVAWRNRKFEALALQATVAFAALLAVGVTTQIQGTVYSYLIRYWWPVVALMWLSAWWSLASSLPARAPARRLARPAAVGALVLALVPSAMAVKATAERDSICAGWSRAISALAGPTVAALPVDGPVFVPSAPVPLDDLFTGMVLALEQRGVEVVIERDKAFWLGEHRVAGANEAVGTVLLAHGAQIERVAAEPGARRLAVYEPTIADRRALAADAAALEARITARERAGLEPAPLDAFMGVINRCRHGEQAAVFYRPGPPDLAD